MIPIGNDVPELRVPWVTIAILATLGGVWIVVQGGGFNQMTLAASVCNLGLIPGELTQQVPVGIGVPIAPGVECLVDRDPINVWTPLTSMFLHGSWGHLLGNGLFLWVLGKSVEDTLGPLRFWVFYLLCGLGAAALQVAVAPASPVPMVGASGAIAGILGGFLFLYPRAHVQILFVLILFIRVITLPAAFVLQPDVAGGVAVWAHIGGFITGALLVRVFANRQLLDAHL